MVLGMFVVRAAIARVFWAGMVSKIHVVTVHVF